MRFGMTTDTGDLDGAVTSRQDNVVLDRADVEAAFREFTGRIQQVPPMYSALKVKGRKLYELARKGETVERPPRTIDIHRFDLLEWDNPCAVFRVHCSKGTYVRTLVEDVGRRLSYGAVLSRLEREAVGGFTIQDSIQWDEVVTMNREQLLSRAIPPEKIETINSGQVQEAKHAVSQNNNHLQNVKRIITKMKELLFKA